MKAGLERDKAALLVVLGAMRDGTKEVLALRSGYRESVESWSEVLRDLKGTRSVRQALQAVVSEGGGRMRWSYFVGQSEGDLKVDSDGLQSPRGSA